VTARLHAALFKPSSDGLSLGRQAGRLLFEFQDDAGLSARKEFEFRANGHAYLLDFTAAVKLGGQDVPVSVSSGPGLGDTDRATGGSFFSPAYYQKPQAIFFRDGKVVRVPASGFAKQSRYEGRFPYIGADDHYFLGALLPGDRDARVDYRQVDISTAQGPRELVVFDTRVSGALLDVRYYLGPKQFDLLAAIGRDFTRVINFGMFSWLVVPLLRALNWVNGYVGNYGWSIILLTILINAVMFPLRHKSVVSMRRMQELQPEVKAIQDRYAKLKATDPQKQKMNVELMNLYRERGVNPASGCVPMLLTFPVLFAFYALLSQAIELRGAPFAGWITDLSVHDPWYITPLLMGGTMVWQQRITPSTADPMQQKMMMFMPVMFTFMFLLAPSGLVIYWFVSNVWAIGQQYLTNYLIGPPKTARPPSDRKARQGAGA
jgi:YidC/Oxa1 family membrane protein insertase